MRELTNKTGDDKPTKDVLKGIKARIEEYEQDGAFIDVKCELNAGEERNVFDRMVKSMVAGEKTEIHPKQVGVAKMAEYILDWNLVGPDGSVVPYSDAALLNLDTDTFNDIHATITAHEEQVQAERTARKNVQAAESASSPPSPSAAL